MQTNNNLHNDKVAIVMSTYNGAKYVVEQLNAVMQQTHTNWHCYIRDDGSSDNTVATIQAHVNNDIRFTVITDKQGNLGYNKSYYALIALANEQYIAMCDQDDVWHANKVEISLNTLKQIETPNKIPALVHTDSVVVDENLNFIKSNFIGKRGRHKGINGILFANSAQGGSVMLNSCLKKIAMPIPAKLPCDYHLAIIASLTGARAFIPQQLLKYRQHSSSIIAVSNLKLRTNGSKNTADNSKNSTDINAKSNLKNKPNLSSSDSLLLSIHMYHNIKNDFNQLAVTKINIKSLNEYFYLFEGENRVKKLFITLKNCYPFYRRKDFAAFIVLLLKNQDLKAL